MRVRVVFRVDATTGQVDEFLVEDISTQPEPEHDATHDRIAYEVGKVVERRPSPQQVVGGVSGDQTPLVYQPEDTLPPVADGETTSE
ncbi:hypothetical protein Daura_39830 [Dactylosporangium aurantiacum]|uniref:FtsH ternary system domain-containing protein n=1 Tax=Dactylosporangium aurantiacum TaxID=35754 RepID=A0A9Q9MKC9_9ACTN|nr:hypothetical protein [Dactylosporangium aurantiacum]MDG6101424.1 hypothetical protein [Dactylosporangium aurantiacum]UWZ52722.1 hypothetical protein Daura_39830 [Dactylosporangium aurantiacum]